MDPQAPRNSKDGLGDDIAGLFDDAPAPKHRPDPGPPARPWWIRFRALLILAALILAVLAWGALRSAPDTPAEPGPTASGQPNVPTARPSAQPSATGKDGSASPGPLSSEDAVAVAQFNVKNTAILFLVTFESRTAKDGPEPILDALRPIMTKAAYAKAEKALRGWDWDGCRARDCAIGTEMSLVTEPFGPDQPVLDLVGQRYLLTGAEPTPDTTVVYRIQVAPDGDQYRVVDFLDVTPTGGE